MAAADGQAEEGEIEDRRGRVAVAARHGGLFSPAVLRFSVLFAPLGRSGFRIVRWNFEEAAASFRQFAEDGQEVAHGVVDGDERLAPTPGERLGRFDPDEKRADQTRATRDGHGVQIAPVGSHPATRRASATTGNMYSM